MDDIKIPTNLNRRTRKWLKKTIKDYELEPHHIKLLLMLGQTWDEMQISVKALKKYGYVYTNKAGVLKTRPEVAILRDSRIAFCRILRELNLSEASDDLRPPPLEY